MTVLTYESVVLNGIEFNDSNPWETESLVIATPPSRLLWISNADVSGQVLADDAQYENLEVTLRIRPAAQANMDAALDLLGAVVAKLADASRLGWVPFYWKPAGSARDARTLRVLHGEVTDRPIDYDAADAGWLLNQPRPPLTIKLTCDPFIYGAESLIATVTNDASPVVTLNLPSVPGDVPALGRLVVTEDVNVARRHLVYGLEQRNYDPVGHPSLLLGESDFTPAPTTTGIPDQYNTHVTFAPVGSAPTAVVTADGLEHVGSFRVTARLRRVTLGGGGGSSFRVAWAVGAGDWQPGAWQSLPLDDRWYEVDLGAITVGRMPVGATTWRLRVEGVTAVDSSTAWAYCDYLALIPTDESYGKVRGSYTYESGTLTAFDNFEGTNGTALNARVAPLGGTWSTAGSTGDFTLQHSGAQALMRRATTGDAAERYAVLGITNRTRVEVGVGFNVTGGSPGTFGVMALVDDDTPSEYIAARYQAGIFGLFNFASGLHVDASYTITDTAWHIVRLLVFSGGFVVAELLRVNSAIDVPVVARVTAALFDLGAIPTSGKVGMFDKNGTGTGLTRNFRDFYVADPMPEPTVLNPNDDVQVRYDGVWRASGVLYGRPPSWNGRDLLIPPAGAGGRTSRLAVKVRRNDVDVDPSPDHGDQVNVAVFATPRYLTVPR
jgi:hypothetical protein